jgi:hypothetical protein
MKIVSPSVRVYAFECPKLRCGCVQNFAINISVAEFVGFVGFAEYAGGLSRLEHGELFSGIVVTDKRD